MALELSIVPDGTRTVAPVTSVEPGEFSSFEDYRTGTPRLLSIGCHPDNSGGAVYSIDPHDDVLDMGSFGTLVHASLHNEDSRVCEIPLDGDTELPIRLASGLGGLLIIEHTSEY